MALEIIYRTKFRRLTNAAHFSIVASIVEYCNHEKTLSPKISRAIDKLFLALTKESNYVLKKYDKTLTSNLKSSIALLNKAYTAVYKMLKYKSEITIGTDAEKSARALISTFDAYMRNRGKKTLGEWVGCELKMADEWGSNEGKQHFQKLGMSDAINDIMKHHDIMIELYHEAKHTMIDYGYTKIAQYRTETDAAMAYLAASFVCLLNDDDPNIVEHAKNAIDGLNYMIEQFSEHVPTANEDENENGKVVPFSPKDTDQNTGSAAVPSAPVSVEDEERTMRENNRNAELMNTGSVRKINELADLYAGEENPFANIDSIPMTDIDETLK